MAERKTSRNMEDERTSKFRKTRKKVCPVCKEKDFTLDYKNTEQLQRFITEKGKILPRRVTGACIKAQRQITKAVKRARQIGTLPYTVD